MKARMMPEEDGVLIDNLEQLLWEINEFCTNSNSLKQDEIPKNLQNYLTYVAKTGNTVFPWPHVKNLFRIKMLSAIASFPAGEAQCPNEAFVLERFDLFRAAPFTIQRFSELIIQPQRHYKNKSKFLNGIEKTVCVVTTVEPKSLNHSEAESTEADNGSAMPWLTSETSEPTAGATTTAAVINNIHPIIDPTSPITVMPLHTSTTTIGELPASSSSIAPSISPLSIHHVLTTSEGNAGEVSIEKSSSGESLELNDSDVACESSLSLSGVLIVEGESGDVTKSTADLNIDGEQGISDTATTPMNIDYNLDIVGPGGDNNNATTNYSIIDTTGNENDGTVTHVNLNQLDTNPINPSNPNQSSLIFTESDGSDSTTITKSDLTVTSIYPSSGHNDDDSGSNTAAQIDITLSIATHENVSPIIITTTTTTDTTTQPGGSSPNNSTEISAEPINNSDFAPSSSPTTIVNTPVDLVTATEETKLFVTAATTAEEEGDLLVDDSKDDSFEFVVDNAALPPTNSAIVSSTISNENLENSLETPNLVEKLEDEEFDNPEKLETKLILDSVSSDSIIVNPSCESTTTIGTESTSDEQKEEEIHSLNTPASFDNLLLNNIEATDEPAAPSSNSILE